MSIIEKYWEAVAQLIADTYGHEPPKNWNKFKIDTFLREFRKKVEVACREDAQKAALCGLAGVRGSDIQSPRFSYHSLRRIFITGESLGNRSTREMFAIYLGFDSVSDFLLKKGIEAAATQPEVSIEHSDVFSFGRGIRSWRTMAALGAVLLAVSVFAHRAHYLEGKRPYIFVKNEKGIAVVDLKERETHRLVETEIVVEIDFDPATRMLFWANAYDNYGCLSSARLDPSLKNIETNTLNTRLTGRMEYPTGIALDVTKKRIYCADYRDSTILVYDYEGRLLSATLTGKMAGRPSSVELDAKNQILYWTDVTNHKIGRVFLDSGVQQPDFITSAGLYPDSLSLDTAHNKLYWACNKSGQVAWADLDAPIPHFTSLPSAPAPWKWIQNRGCCGTATGTGT